MPPQSESSFQRQVLALAAMHGWLSAHFRPSLNQRGKWQTAVAGDGKGFLDLVLVRDRVLWIELKSESGRVSAEQQTWIDRLTAAGQEVHVWRPRDWVEIERVLGR